RFVPAVMFWTGQDDEVIEISTPVTSVSALTVTDHTGETTTEVQRGLMYAVDGHAVTTPEGGSNAAVRWAVEGATSTRTHISATGVLTVGGDEGADTLTVRATSTWLDPANIRKAGEESTATLAVTGEPVIDWPREDEEAPVEGQAMMAAGTTFQARTVSAEDR